MGKLNEIQGKTINDFTDAVTTVGIKNRFVLAINACQSQRSIENSKQSI
jgi:hypothetical protein